MCRASKILCLWFALGLYSAVAAASAFEANPYFREAAELEKYLIENSDLAKTLDAFSVEPRPSGTWRLKFEGDVDEVSDDGSRYKQIPIAVLMDYSYTEKKIVAGTGRIAGIAFCEGYADISGTPSCYTMPKVSQEHQERAAVIARHFINGRAPTLLKDTHRGALSDFRAGRKADAAKIAAELISALPWKVVPITADNVESYNDLGFFLEQGGKYKEAVQVLEEITRAVPDRAAAYLNLGDAYLGLSDIPRAKSAYRQYQKLMEQSGKGAKIPKRIRKYVE